MIVRVSGPPIVLGPMIWQNQWAAISEVLDSLAVRDVTKAAQWCTKIASIGTDPRNSRAIPMLNDQEKRRKLFNSRWRWLVSLRGEWQNIVSGVPPSGVILRCGAKRLKLKYPIRRQLRADDGSVKSGAAKLLAMEMIIFLSAEKIKQRE
jgi:hypothetical protein